LRCGGGEVIDLSCGDGEVIDSRCSDGEVIDSSCDGGIIDSRCVGVASCKGGSDASVNGIGSGVGSVGAAISIDIDTLE